MGAPTTLASKLRSLVHTYRNDVEDVNHVALDAKSKTKKADALTDLRTTAWFEGRCVLLLELYEKGHLPEAVLVDYVNRFPGRKVTLSSVVVPVKPAPTPVAAPRRLPELRWVFHLRAALFAFLCVGLAVVALSQ